MHLATASTLAPLDPMTQTLVHRVDVTLEVCMPLFKKILVPIDGSDTSDKAMRMALDMAREALGTVRFVHVMEDDRYWISDEFSADLRSYGEKNAQELLQKAMDAARGMGVNAQSQVLDKPGQRLGESVANEAADWGADLVVLGTHGRRGLGRMLLGSGAEQVIRLSPVPVLVVRGD
jgi:nucleotide-binding universal stress UspA family protein